ncbi:unnamed protein product [Mytilus coruscus]|uniref:B box-type domain-containing protein n=1 Tax=Mytilus coruscus TaxID=42192 RepID=A0A6J7ZW36_MYTCO|nr:unnamed protein product [Mytilus coruscus]
MQLPGAQNVKCFFVLNAKNTTKDQKASKEHNTMSTNDYRNLPKSMHETSNRCKDHDKKYDIYCAIHSCPCCVQCVTEDHQKCQDLKPLADILKDVKSSANIPILKKDLDDLKDSFKNLLNVLEDRMETINLQKTKGIEEVRSMRKLLDDYLDKLERQIIDELVSKHSKMKTDTELLVKQMEYRTKRVDQLIDKFSTITQYATELQTYIGLREIENTASKESKYLEELDSGGLLDNQNLEITLSPALQSILQEVQSFGHISFKSSPHGIQVMTGRKDQAQNLVPVFHSIKQMKPSVKVTLNVPKSERFQIYACQILPDSTFYFSIGQRNA